MIVVKYEEVQIDSVTGAVTRTLLGTESHELIEEVLLPSAPVQANPIFFTKKFAGNREYRWEVEAVIQDLAAAQRTFIVTLQRRSQIDRRWYLKNILATRNDSARHVLVPWAVVEVEFGHPLMVGKENGNIRSNKRYADTMQSLSMPKRRLAIVNQVHPGRDELIQVIPISSRPPRAADKTMVEVTSCLTNMVQYQKPSWAVCRMMQTVTASRVIAPLVQTALTTSTRDKGFKTQIRGGVRSDLKDALMYGVAADGRVAAAQVLSETQAKVQLQDQQVIQLMQELAVLKEQTKFYEKWAKDADVTMDDLQEIYPD